MKTLRNGERGETNVMLITTIIFAVLAVGLGVGFGWAFMGKNEAETNLDAKLTAAKEEQRIIEEAICDEKLSSPHSTFNGPADFGSVSFNYPRTWSSYIENNGTQGSSNLVLYFNKGSVPRIDDKTIFSLRFSVVSRAYETVLADFSNGIKNGTLTAQPFTINDYEGMRISGKISDSIGNATIVVFKIREKTLVLRTDSTEFLSDFDNIVLATLRYQP